jgi:hypothetical protein
VSPAALDHVFWPLADVTTVVEMAAASGPSC